MYRLTDGRPAGTGPDPVKTGDRMVKALEDGDIAGIGRLLYNDFEEVVPEQDKIRTLKRLLTEAGACGSLMTGSGSAVFGIFEKDADRDRALERISRLAEQDEEALAGCRTYACRAVNEEV